MTHRSLQSKFVCTITLNDPPPILPPENQIERFNSPGDDALMARLYSMFDGEYAYDKNETELVLRAEFIRHPSAPRGHLEERMTSHPSRNRGPAWACRSRAALEMLIDRVLFFGDVHYVLVPSRGSKAGEGGAGESRVLPVPDIQRCKLTHTWR